MFSPRQLRMATPLTCFGAQCAANAVDQRHHPRQFVIDGAFSIRPRWFNAVQENGNQYNRTSTQSPVQKQPMSIHNQPVQKQPVNTQTMQQQPKKATHLNVNDPTAAGSGNVNTNVNVSSKYETPPFTPLVAQRKQSNINDET